jgi:sugar transferase (PEP-CTERM/EpsH1 system associated)
MFHTADELAVDHEVELLIIAERPVDRTAIEALQREFDAVHLFAYRPYRFYLNTVRGVVSRRPLQTHYYHFSEVDRWVDANIDRFDVAFCNHVRTTEYVQDRDIVRMADLVDAISRNYRTAAQRADGLWRAIYPVEWRRLRRYERYVASRFDQSFIITEKDREFLTDGESFPCLSVLTNGVKPELLERQPARHRTISSGPSIAFLGKMDYFPNEDAAHHFCKEIFPKVRAAYPEANFSIVGASPSDRVMELDAEPGVTVTGFVEDPWEYLLQADLVVAPMRQGAGLQNKVLEALALGCPTLTTPLAREGIAAIDGCHLAVASGATAFADRAVSLLGDVDQRRSVGSAGRELIASNYTWSRVGKHLRRSVSDALDSHQD